MQTLFQRKELQISILSSLISYVLKVSFSSETLKSDKLIILKKTERLK